MPGLEPLTTNRYTVKDSFNFATEIVDPDSSNSMDSLDIDSFFTNIPPEEAIETCNNDFFKKNGMVHGLKKVNLKVFYIATKESYFIFNNIFYKKNGGVALRCPLGPS